MDKEINTDIKTPRGGHPLWVNLIALDDDILGSITFKDNESHKEFKRMYALLDPDRWGLVELTFDKDK